MTDRFLFPVARLLKTTITLNVFLSQYIPLIKHRQLKQFEWLFRYYAVYIHLFSPSLETVAAMLFSLKIIPFFFSLQYSINRFFCGFFFFFWTESQAAALPNEVFKNVFIAGEEFFPYQITVLIFVTEACVIPGLTFGKDPLFCETLSVLNVCKIKKKRNGR